MRKHSNGNGRRQIYSRSAAKEAQLSKEREKCQNDPMYLTRYFVEHELLPEIFFSEQREAFLDELFENGAEFIHYLYCKEYQKRGLECPYTKEQFDFSPTMLDDNVIIIDISLPCTEQFLLCSRIVLALTEDESSAPRFFTVEFDHKERGKPVFFLCEWLSDRTHSFHGEISIKREAQLLVASRLYYQGMLSGE